MNFDGTVLLFVFKFIEMGIRFGVGSSNVELDLDKRVLSHRWKSDGKGH